MSMPRASRFIDRGEGEGEGGDVTEAQQSTQSVNGEWPEWVLAINKHAREETRLRTKEMRQCR